MKTLTINGFGSDIRVDRGRLRVKNGRTKQDEELMVQEFKPKFVDFDSVVVNGHTGSITFEAVRWLMKQNIPITFLDWNGKLLTSISPKRTVKTGLKFAQFQAHKSEKRIEIAKQFVGSKAVWSKAVLEWLKAKYPEVDSNVEVESRKLGMVRTIPKILSVEGRMARIYWTQIQKIIGPELEFESRFSSKMSRPSGAVDPTNALLNYGYAVLESQCLKSINTVGLDPHVGFLHEPSTGKISLAYDLQEPFRWLIDVAIIKALENKVFSKKDFVITENYNIKLKPDATKKLIREIDSMFGQRVQYKGKKRTWAYMITIKTRELADYLTGRSRKLDLTKPAPNLKREDTHKLRQKILDLSYTEAKKIGISKGTLHYMKKNAKSQKPFKIYKNSLEKLK